MSSVSVRLPDEVARGLTKLARLTDRPKSYFIVKALESYLAEYTDYQVALDRLRDKDDPVVSSAELRRLLAAGE
ncbi:MAG: ribbon-helix-helix protein, CopG family [Acidobacteriota bacterium]